MPHYDHNRSHIMRQRANNDTNEMNSEELARERERAANSQARLQRKLKQSSQRMQKVQARSEMEISQPGDSHEKEADEIAEKVSNGERKEITSATPPPADNIHRKKELMAKSEDGTLSGTGQLEATLESSKGSGEVMDDKIKSEMESRMNADLSDVRIHTGPQAHEMAEGINAKAFTHGQDVYFKNGNYDPDSKEGKNLLAHELVHTQQQKDEVNRKVQRQPSPKKDKKQLRSHVMSGPGSEQLLATLNEDSKDGHQIGEGATGPYVILIQKALNLIYQDHADYIPLKIEKDFGPKTKQAVSRFQKDYHLTQGTNGVVGAETIEAMDREASLKEEVESFKTSLELYDVFNSVEKETNKKNATNPDSTSKNETEPGAGLSFEGAGVAPMQSYFYKSGSTKVDANVALNIIENVAKGEPPFKPELGKGGSSWFTIEGNPYVGKKAMNKPIRIDAEIFKMPDRLIFGEADLVKMYNMELAAFIPTAETRYRTFNKIPANQPLTPKQQKGLEYYIKTRTEESMWAKIGQKVKESKSKSGEIVYEPGSRFSDNPGRVAVIADPSLITIKNGMTGLLNQLFDQGLGKEPVLLETGEKLAKKMKWAGAVRGVFRYAGRILVVMGIATDIYKVYKASDKLKAVIESAGGWAGASAAATTFAELWTPADAAGPVAWLLHGVGTLISGAIGYWIGSSTTRTVYETAVEGEVKKEASKEQPTWEGIEGGGGSFGGGGAGGKW